MSRKADGLGIDGDENRLDLRAHGWINVARTRLRTMGIAEIDEQPRAAKLCVGDRAPLPIHDKLDIPV